MWAGKADEDHAARVFCDPVHHAEHNPLPLPPGVKIITLRLPWFERGGAYRNSFWGPYEQRRAGFSITNIEWSSLLTQTAKSNVCVRILPEVPWITAENGRFVLTTLINERYGDVT
jgi:hypothetical protein